MSKNITIKKLMEIMKETKKELCTNERDYDEFERGARIALHNLLLKLNNGLTKNGE